MILVKIVIALLVSPSIGLAADYVDSEYVIPPHETEGRINTRCEEPYVPVHSQELLRRVQDWAVGITLIKFAEVAGYTFDVEAYDQDVPHRGLFNFGFATATSCLEVDVLRKMIGMDIRLSHLVRELSKDPSRGQGFFKEVYTLLAEDLGFSHYLSDHES